MLMGEFDSTKDIVAFENSDVSMIGVRDIDDACKMAVKLVEDGVDCIELCGAFKEEGAKKIIKATGNKIPIAYVTHLKEQDEMFFKLFGN